MVAGTEIREMAQPLRALIFQNKTNKKQTDKEHSSFREFQHAQNYL